MGNNVACCKSESADGQLGDLDAANPSPQDSTDGGDDVALVSEQGNYNVTLDKGSGKKLGLDVDYMPERSVLPVMAITGDLAAAWNAANSKAAIKKGDSIINVNGSSGNVVDMLDLCKHKTVLELKLVRALNYDALVMDLEHLLKKKPDVGALFVQASWNDAGVYVKDKGGCGNAALRFTDGGEGSWKANATLGPQVQKLLKKIIAKYVPLLINHADLYALAANVSMRMMGGPSICCKFGRVDAKSAKDGVQKEKGHLPTGEEDAAALRKLYAAKGLNDEFVVPLAALRRLNWAGSNPTKMDNSYFKELVKKEPSDTLQPADLALAKDAEYHKLVEKYAKSQATYFEDLAKAWVKFQELGYDNLREEL